LEWIGGDLEDVFSFLLQYSQSLLRQLAEIAIDFITDSNGASSARASSSVTEYRAAATTAPGDGPNTSLTPRLITHFIMLETQSTSTKTMV